MRVFPSFRRIRIPVNGGDSSRVRTGRDEFIPKDNGDRNSSLHPSETLFGAEWPVDKRELGADDSVRISRR